VAADRVVAPWGLTRMKPFPHTAALSYVEIVLDPETQIGRWVGEDGRTVPAVDRHKKSRTWKDTKPKTSLDGNTDEGSDQDSDTD
jgi:putative ATP-grasp target RiPP